MNTKETRQRRKYPRFNRRHAGVFKWLVEHPTATLNDGAVALGYSRSWLSRIVNSPEFRAKLDEFQDEVWHILIRQRIESYRCRPE